MHLQHLSGHNLLLQDCGCSKGSSWLPPPLGHLLWCLCRTHWFCRCWRNFNSSLESSDDLFQPWVLRSWLVSNLPLLIKNLYLLCHSVVFQWTVSYMISPDAANLGIKAVYVWAGLLVPFTILLWLYYPEVSLSKPHVDHQLTQSRPTVVHTGNSTNCTSARFLLGSSRAPPPLLIRVVTRMLLSCLDMPSRRQRQ